MDLAVRGNSLCGVVWYRTLRINVPAACRGLICQVTIVVGGSDNTDLDRSVSGKRTQTEATLFRVVCCCIGSHTTEHLLQSCPVYEPLRKGFWAGHTPVARKLYGSLRDLRCTAAFIEETGVTI